MNLIVIHGAGQSSICVTNIPNGFIAKTATESGPEQILFNGDLTNDPFDMCRSWASANIRGEFRIELGTETGISSSAVALGMQQKSI